MTTETDEKNEFNEDDAVFRMYFKRYHEMHKEARKQKHGLTFEAVAAVATEAYYRGRSEAINVVREEVHSAVREEFDWRQPARSDDDA